MSEQEKESKPSSVFIKAIDEEEEMEEFVNIISEDFRNLIGNTCWNSESFGDNGIILKGDPVAGTHLVRLRYNHYSAVATNVRGMKRNLEPEFFKMKYLDEHLQGLDFEILVHKDTPYNSKYSLVYDEAENAKQEFTDCIASFPDVLFIHNKVHDRYYRVMVSSTFQNIFLFAGQHGYCLMSYDSYDDNDFVGYHRYSSVTDYPYLSELKDNIHRIIDTSLTEPVILKTEDGDFDLAKSFCYHVLSVANEKLEDPYLEDGDLEGDPLHFLCGNQEQLDELTVMILQATLTDKQWSQASNDKLSMTYVASYDDAEAHISENDYGNDVGDFLEENPLVEACLEEALTQNEPCGYTVEYNDGPHDRKSGYDDQAESVIIDIVRPSAHVKMLQVSKLINWCKQFGLESPIKQTN